MDIRKLQRAIVDGLEDVKAQDIQVFNTEHLSPLFERVIVASGTSNRQTRALSSSVRESVKKSGLPVMRTEGEDNGEWIIVDCGAAVVHIMQPAIRQYYHLEEIWGGKPVKLKLADEARSLPKASEPDAADDEPAAVKKPARKAAAKPAASAKPAGKSPAAKGAAAKSAAKPVAKPAGKSAVKPAAKSPAKKAVGKSAGKPAAKTAVQKVVVKSSARGAARPAAKSAARPAAKKSAGKPAAKTARAKR